MSRVYVNDVKKWSEKEEISSEQRTVNCPHSHPTELLGLTLKPRRLRDQSLVYKSKTTALSVFYLLQGEIFSDLILAQLQLPPSFAAKTLICEHASCVSATVNM